MIHDVQIQRFEFDRQPISGLSCRRRGSIFCLRVTAAMVVVLLAGRLSAQEVVEATAFTGKPFGVARVEVLVDPRTELSGSVVSERNDRVFYPTHSTSTARPVRRLLREIVGAPQKIEAYFLFTGEAPLELSVAGSPANIRVRPESSGEGHAALLSEWWENYASLDKREAESKDYPTVVEDYLIGTLARRLRLPLPKAFLEEPKSDDLTHAVRVLGGAESVRSQWIRRVALGQAGTGPADLELPDPLPFTSPDPSVDAKVKVEAIADRIPPELFYVRFGSFPNYLWFSHRLDEWSGEVTSLVSERSIDYGLNKRQQVQLCLEESALAEVLGPAVISDVALVGTDMFLRDGAAMGILFEARNSALLANDIGADRAEAMKANPTAVEEQVTIGDRKVSFVHTADNRLRSFYLAIDNYHLVTTSRAIVERFVQVAKDGKSLGKTAEFRYNRTLFPTDRNDTVFVYLSSVFLQNLVSPRYQVELQRRLHSLAEMDVLGVARLEAHAQGVEANSIDELLAVGILPRSFNKRADGSRLEERDGVVVDSLRGPRGMFLPIPDVRVKGVTAEEAENSQRVARKYAASWQQMTPIVAAVTRSKGAKEGLEQVSLDLRLTPLAAQQYKMLASQLGAPTNRRLAPIAGDVVAIDAVLSQALGSSGEDYHLFGGLRDLDPRLMSGTMLEKLLGMFGGKEIEGYVGAFPRPGVLWLLGASANLPVDEGGYSQFITGSWRRIVGQFTLMSFQPEVLAEITPQLKFIPTERPAQAWLHAEDLKESKLEPALNAYGYRKATELSRGNIRFLTSLSEQLHVPPAEALASAETLLAARLLCALGGKYEFIEGPNDHSRWVSNASAVSAGRSVSPPSDYEFPAVYWLRGLDAELRLTEEELALHADIQMPVQVRATPALQLPSFGLPFGNKPKAPEEVPAKPQKPEPAKKPREF